MMMKYKFYSISRCKSFYANVYSLCAVTLIDCAVVNKDTTANQITKNIYIHNNHCLPFLSSLQMLKMLKTNTALFQNIGDESLYHDIKITFNCVNLIYPLHIEKKS